MNWIDQNYTADATIFIIKERGGRLLLEQYAVLAYGDVTIADVFHQMQGSLQERKFCFFSSIYVDDMATIRENLKIIICKKRKGWFFVREIDKKIKK